MRTTLRSLGILALAVCLTAIAGCAKKSDPAAASAAAETFFHRLSEGQIQDAYASAAFGFQAAQSQKAFEATTKEMGLAGTKSVNLAPPEFDDDTAKLRAEAVTLKGDKLPLVVTLHFESGQWRVFSLKSPRSTETGLVENRFSLVGKGSSFHDAATEPIPDEKTIRKLVRQAMIQFNDALQQRSFADFYENVAQSWKAQLTLNQLQRAFQPFIDKRVDISGIAEVEPVFDAPPQMSSDGLLIVSGHYPLQPYKVDFSLKFIYELPDWKLFGIDVNLLK